MKEKLLKVIIVIVSISLCTALYFTSQNSNLLNNQNLDALVRSKINDININIDKLDKLDNSNNFSDAFILLTEIKQDSKMIVDVYVYSETKNDKAIALGDLLGYIYYYIDDIEPEKTNKESLTKNINELVQINNTFLKVTKADFKNQEDYLEFFKNEIERNIEKHPENAILKKYSNRKLGR